MPEHHRQVEAERLTVFVNESARHGGMPLYEWLIERASREGLCGGTAIKALCGFGRHGRIHHQHVLALARDLPVVVEMIDTAERIDAFVAGAAEELKGCTYIRERVRWHGPEG